MSFWRYTHLAGLFRPDGKCTMKHLKWLAIALVSATLLASDSPQGIVPRANADKYEAHATVNELAIGASLLSSSDAHKITSSDLNKCCVVVEVAIYPPKDGNADVSLSDFGLRTSGHDDTIRPSSVEVIAGKLQSQPSAPGPDYDASTNSSVSYGTGTDPATGRRVTTRTVSNGAGVGFGVGGDPNAKASPGEIERHNKELELRARAVPEGSTTAPVAGYLYFAAIKKKGVKYELEYALGTKTLILTLK